jgi:hypothetical protein
MRLWISAFTHDEDGEATDHGEIRSGVPFDTLEEQVRDVIDVVRSDLSRPSVVEVRIRVAA